MMKGAIAIEATLKPDREIQCRLSLLQAPLTAPWPPLTQPLGSSSGPRSSIELAMKLQQGSIGLAPPQLDL